jgi:2',3'-cyclic-nucleotide 2'-phosphodiesterase (5'-nucleotidase family)
MVTCYTGTLRSDMVHPAGGFRLRDLVALLPMPDTAVVVEATGAQVGGWLAATGTVHNAQSPQHYTGSK